MSLRKRRSPAGMHILVTGAASGIGRAVAQQLGRSGVRLYLTDLHQQPLQEVADEIVDQGGLVVMAVAADLTDHADVAALAKQVHAAVDSLDAVLNIAGVAIWGAVQTLTHQQWHSTIDVNLMGPIHVIEEFLPPMIAAGHGGHLVNVSSAAGLVGLPWHAAYSAGKFGIRGVSEVLRFDLAKHQIAVTLVCPGGVDTPMVQRVQINGADQDNEDFHKLQQRFQRHAVSPESAAATIIDGMLRGRYLVYTSTDVKLVHALQRHLPRVYAVLMSLINRVADRAVPGANP